MPLDARYLDGMPDHAGIAREFGLGELRSVRQLADGHSTVQLLTTALGRCVVKPAVTIKEAELRACVAVSLDRTGIRAARPVRTTAGSLIGESGYGVQEFLPGTTCVSPTGAQAADAMRHLAARHSALDVRSSCDAFQPDCGFGARELE